MGILSDLLDCFYTRTESGVGNIVQSDLSLLLQYIRVQVLCILVRVTHSSTCKQLRASINYSMWFDYDVRGLFAHILYDTRYSSLHLAMNWDRFQPTLASRQILSTPFCRGPKRGWSSQPPVSLALSAVSQDEHLRLPLQQLYEYSCDAAER